MKLSIYLIIPMLLIYLASGAQKHTLSLEDAFTLGLKNNRKLRISEIENRKSDETIKEYRSFLQPSINATASYAFYAERPVIFLRDEAADKKVNGVKVGGTNSLNTGIAASYPLLQPILHERVKLATINAELQRQKTEELASDLLLDIAQTYLSIQFYREQIILFQQSLERNERALADFRSLFRQGKGLKTDTLRNSIDVQNLKASISSLDNQIAIQCMVLKQMLGVDGNVDFVLTDQLYTPSAFSDVQHPDSVSSIAWTNRPDVKAGQLMIGYRQAEHKLVVSEFRPSLHAVAQYQLQAQSDQFSFWNYNLPRTSFIGLQLNVPIFSGKRIKYKTAQAKYGIEQSEIELDDLKQDINKEIRTLTASLREFYIQKDIQQKTLEAAQVNYTMTNDRYTFGLSNRLELADAELALTKARINHLHAVYLIRLTTFQLQKASGNLKR
jgi:outer membrane protein